SRIRPESSRVGRPAMVGRVDASRDLRLGLFALESGAIDQEQLVSAIRAWARSPERTLSKILVGRGLLDEAAISRLEEQVTRNLETPPGPDRSVPSSGLEPAATLSYVGGANQGHGEDTGNAIPLAIGGRRFQVVRPHARGGLGEV